MPRFYHHGDGTNRRVDYSRAGGQYHGVTMRGGGRVDDGQSEQEQQEAQEEFDRLLAAQPDEPPTPAEQAARDDNDALGDR
jgi:hypothetical protein